MLLLAVVANSVHAKELATLTVPISVDDTKKVADTQPVAKVSAELHLHTHMDKQIVKSPLAIATDNPQADHRSLRLVHDQRKEFSHRFRVAGKLHDWLQTTALYLNQS